MKNYIAPAFAASLLLGANAIAGAPAAPYQNSSIDARLNVTVSGDTDVVHFVRDNADPSVFTKAYIVKHVDVYELRTYLRKIVQTRKVDSDNTNVEAVRFTDGTSVLLVSAEDYRFADTPGAQGIDSIIRELDKPRLVASSGNKTYIYSPKYRSAQELMEMVNEVGAYSADVRMGNLGGIDTITCDPGLNLVFLYTSPFSRRTIMEVLAAYDQPYPEINARITVYELYAENDAQLGLDFQAWKNNDGMDLFGAGGRFSQNHNSAGLLRDGDWNRATYYQFNPKWNTKYLDFLASKGKAKVVHTSNLTLRNNTTGSIQKYTKVFVAKAEPLAETVQPEQYTVLANASRNIALTRDGKSISVNAAANVTVIRHGVKNTFEYILRLPDDAAGVFFMIDGQNAGKVVKASQVNDAALRPVAGGYPRGNRITTEASDQFGFELEMTPSINTKATTLNVKIVNRSLIGYTSKGEPRIQKGAMIDTNFMISNAGTKLVIGGIEKRSVVSVSGGVPILKDLPLLGWLFSTESESTKRSQLVIVAELLPQAPDANCPVIKKVQKKLGNAGVTNTFGYRQYLIDSER